MKAPAQIWNERHKALGALLIQAVAHRLQTGAVTDRRDDAAVAEAVAGFVELVGTNPFYLARSLDAETKRACVTTHYDLLMRHFSDKALQQLLWSTTIWTSAAVEPALSIRLRFVHAIAREGELTMELFAETKLLYILSFTFAPASRLGLEGGLAILLTRVQGSIGEFDDIRAATKAMSEVQPRAALFAALTGIAAATGVRYILGCAAENLIGFVPDMRETLVRQYDEFFLSLDGAPRGDGFYVIDTHAEPKPVTAQKTGHRVRTRRKREFKAQVAQSAREAWVSFGDTRTEASAA